MEVTVTISEILIVEYEEFDPVDFVITADDLMDEDPSLGMMNLGDLHWWANTAPWKITTIRTAWDPTEDFILQIKYGPPDNDNWHTIQTSETIWITGDSTGWGTYDGVDWKIKNFGWDTAPGTYTCTVTFTISPG